MSSIWLAILSCCECLDIIYILINICNRLLVRQAPISDHFRRHTLVIYQLRHESRLSERSMGHAWMIYQRRRRGESRLCLCITSVALSCASDALRLIDYLSIEIRQWMMGAQREQAAGANMMHKSSNVLSHRWSMLPVVRCRERATGKQTCGENDIWLGVRVFRKDMTYQRGQVAVCLMYRWWCVLGGFNMCENDTQVSK